MKAQPIKRQEDATVAAQAAANADGQPRYVRHVVPSDLDKPMYWAITKRPVGACYKVKPNIDERQALDEVAEYSYLVDHLTEIASTRDLLEAESDALAHAKAHLAGAIQYLRTKGEAS